MRFFESKNYDEFVFMEGNRPIVESNVKRFMKIIETDGLHDEVEVNPVKVNGKWVVVDGQHRFLAHKRLGRAVPCITKRRNVELKGIIDINTVRKSWTILDRVKSWATLGNEPHIRLLNLWEELNAVHPIRVGTLAKMAQGSLASSIKATHRTNLNDENWVFVCDESDIRKVYNECVKFTSIDDKVMSDTFIHCIQSLMTKQPGFDIKRMYSSAKANPHKFVRAARKQDMLRMLEELYNYNRTASNRLYFDMNNL